MSSTAGHASTSTLLEQPGHGRGRGFSPVAATYSMLLRSPHRSAPVEDRARSTGSARALSTSPVCCGSAAVRSPAGSVGASRRQFASSRSASPQHTPSPPQSPSHSWRVHRRSKATGIPANVILGTANVPAIAAPANAVPPVAVGSIHSSLIHQKGRCHLEARRQELCEHICQLQALHTELRYLDNIFSAATQFDNSSSMAGIDARCNPVVFGERFEASLTPLLGKLVTPEHLEYTSSPVVPNLRLACDRIRSLVEPWAVAAKAGAGVETSCSGIVRCVVPSNAAGGVAPVSMR